MLRLLSVLLVVILPVLSVSVDINREVENMKVLMHKLETEVISLKSERKDYVDKFETEIQILKNERKDYVDKFDKLETEIQTLKDERKALNTYLGFTAYPVDDLAIYKGQPVVFNNTLSNVGDFYTIGSGTFVVPFDGIYFFSLSTYAEPGSAAAIYLMRDGSDVISARTMTDDERRGTTNSVLLECNQGELISLEATYDGLLYMGAGKQNTFTGFLVELTPVL